MNLEEELKAYGRRLVDQYEEKFHRDYPDGMTVADYCNREVPGTCFDAGFAAAAELYRLAGRIEALGSVGPRDPDCIALVEEAEAQLRALIEAR